jgi:hypothetical protein
MDWIDFQGNTSDTVKCWKKRYKEHIYTFASVSKHKLNKLVNYRNGVTKKQEKYVVEIVCGSEKN